MLEKLGKGAVDTEIIENLANDVADEALRRIARTLPKNYICMSVANEILERAKESIQLMPVETLQQYLDI